MRTDHRAAPAPSSVSQPYWDAARTGELALQRCADCARFTHPPAEWCRSCGSERRTFVAVAGTGSVDTFSIVHRSFAPGFTDRVPYVIAWIALDDQPGVRVFGNVLDTPVDEVTIGLRVELTFEDIPGFGPVPNFRPETKENRCTSE